ncbi:DUF2093 domain-containing protein [Notoacmeibacter sp. MSK16QG-6]|uniref:DUF2093 domain-containing protein n=1 Tax=Notoacmeibacter sp. MSK16QG-6 TaxID=2957982 RepID=UPI00209E20DB|nr:DUF2093 domain-containing protein [Notoacmeibacter sp. MSK16QG-6]MCP1198495.1 DUF2093 domain-containing protein [Notoacmeibacter sp. MSK16QG-6]
MNHLDFLSSREAEVQYLDGDYRIKRNGSFVRCAVTGEPIPLEELKYWSVDRQEAYRDCNISLQRELELNPDLRKRRKD